MQFDKFITKCLRKKPPLYNDKIILKFLYGQLFQVPIALRPEKRSDDNIFFFFLNRQISHNGATLLTSGKRGR